MTSYGTLSLSQLNVYDNNDSSGNLSYNTNNSDGNFYMNKGLDVSGNIDLSGNLTINGVTNFNGIIFPDGSIQYVASTGGSGGDVTTSGVNTFTNTNTFTSTFTVNNASTNIGQFDNSNTFIGEGSYSSTSTGTDNTAFGNKALNSLTSGNYNVAIGKKSNFNLTEGNSNVAIGYETGVDSNDTSLSNTIAIGNSITSVASGDMIFGFSQYSNNYDYWAKFTPNTTIGGVQLQGTYNNSGNFTISAINQSLLLEATFIDLNGTGSGQISGVNVSNGMNINTGVVQTTDKASNPTFQSLYSCFYSLGGLPYFAYNNGTTTTYQQLATTTNTNGDVYLDATNTYTSTSVNNFEDAYITCATQLNSDNSTFVATTKFVQTRVGTVGQLTNNNTGIGNIALENATGSRNCAFGHASLSSGVSGDSNTAYGYSSLILCSSGNNNSAFGISTLQNVTTSDYNTACGSSSLLNLTTGQSNTACGSSSLLYLTTGSFNTSIGNESGSYLAPASQNNTLIGDATGPLTGDTATYNYLTCIGADSIPVVTGGSNQIVLGSITGNETVYIPGGNIVLGNNQPGQPTFTFTLQPTFTDLLFIGSDGNGVVGDILDLSYSISTMKSKVFIIDSLNTKINGDLTLFNGQNQGNLSINSSNGNFAMNTGLDVSGDIGIINASLIFNGVNTVDEPAFLTINGNGSFDMNKNLSLYSSGSKILLDGISGGINMTVPGGTSGNLTYTGYFAMDRGLQVAQTLNIINNASLMLTNTSNSNSRGLLSFDINNNNRFYMDKGLDVSGNLTVNGTFSSPNYVKAGINTIASGTVTVFFDTPFPDGSNIQVVCSNHGAGNFNHYSAYNIGVYSFNVSSNAPGQTSFNWIAINI